MSGFEDFFDDAIKKASDNLPPSGGSFAQGSDNEIRFNEGDRYNRPYYVVGEKGSPPTMEAVREMFTKAIEDPGESFITLSIGGDKVAGDSGSLGGEAFPWRGYKKQRNDVENHLREALTFEDFANRIAPVGHKWTGAGSLRIATK